jgi:hypothetical protein
MVTFSRVGDDYGISYDCFIIGILVLNPIIGESKTELYHCYYCFWQ